MSIVIGSILAAAVPTLLYISLIYWIDRYEKEPWWLLGSAFFWGAVPSILAALLFSWLFTMPVYYLAGQELGDAFGPIVAAPVVEEILKGLALLGILLFWRHEIDSILDGIIYGAMVGLGFGMVENFFYFTGAYSTGGTEGWIANITLRTLFSLNHALFSAMTGLGIAIARLSNRRAVQIGAPLIGLSVGMFLHFVHNTSAVLADTLSPVFCFVLPINGWGGVTVTLAIMIWALWQEKRWIREYLREEIAHDTLTPDQYTIACSSRRRLLHYVELLGDQGWRGYQNGRRFYQHCSELAYKKRHFAHFQDRHSQRLIPELRTRVAALSRQLINAPSP